MADRGRTRELAMTVTVPGVRRRLLGVWIRLSILSVGLAAYSADGPKLYTLDECIEIGLRRSVEARKTALDRSIADAKVARARSVSLPQFSLDAAYTRLDELQSIELGDGSVDLGALDNYSVDIRVQQMLYSGGRAMAGIRAAGLAVNYADLDAADVKAKLVRDIKIAFYDILLAREVLGVRKQSVSILAGSFDQTAAKFRNGTASEFELLNARVRLSNDRPNLILAQNQYELAKESFRRLLDLGPDPFELSGVLDFVPMEVNNKEMADRAVAAHPLVRAGTALVGLKEQDVISTKSGTMPSVVAAFNYNGANSYAFVAYEGPAEWHWNASMTVSWPLWDGGLTRGTTRQKALELEKARTELEDLKKGVRLQVRQACLEINRSAQVVAAGKESVALAEEAIEIAKTMYESGLATQLEFADANLSLSTARLTYMRALREHATAVAILKYVAALD